MKFEVELILEVDEVDLHNAMPDTGERFILPRRQVMDAIKTCITDGDVPFQLLKISVEDGDKLRRNG